MFRKLLALTLLAVAGVAHAGYIGVHDFGDLNKFAAGGHAEGEGRGKFADPGFPAYLHTPLGTFFLPPGFWHGWAPEGGHQVPDGFANYGLFQAWWQKQLKQKPEHQHPHDGGPPWDGDHEYPQTVEYESAVPVTSVPEPGSLTLLGVGLLTLVAVRRSPRRR